MQGKYELYENKTYIELFIKLRKANEEVYLFKFGNEFNKTRIALWKQINNLIEKKYVKKRIEGRKSLFSLTKKGNELADKIIEFEKIKKIFWKTK